MKKNLLIPSLGVLILVLVFSCVKDTDFEQANNIVLTPVVEADLIFFDLEARDFYDTSTNTPILSVRDTTEIRFLDDTGIQESLTQIDFLFRFTSSIPRNFTVDFEFLDSLKILTYATSTPVSSGTIASPVVTDFIHTVTGDDLELLTMADRVAVIVTIPSSNSSLDGVLNLKSKTTYFLEIMDRE